MRVGGLAGMVGLFACAIYAAEPSAKPVGVERDGAAARVLAVHCLECHRGPDRKGGLDLSARAAALAGGDSGPALEADAASSRIWKRVEAGEMPPQGRPPLSEADREVLRAWLDNGAVWPVDSIDPFAYSSTNRAGYDWWSLQPLQVVEPPAVSTEQKGWVRNPIDRFVLRQLESAGLRPAEEASRRALIRRLQFDLSGLPPSPEDVEQFVRDPDPRAYENLVDRLLDSPHYGERWARRWLDLVRFGESQGFERNKFRPNAWKYRDFVVEALNSDLPYDDFVRWQLAGDVLRPHDPLAVIASGFLAVGPYDLTAYTNGTAEMRAFAREEELEGLMATVCQTFLGLTVNCARCHDHKFDPITQAEYYQLSAALGGTFQGDERESVPLDARADVDARIGRLREELATLGQPTPEAKFAEHARRESLIRLLAAGPVHTTVPKQPDAWRILARGDFRQPREEVVPRGLKAIRLPASDWMLDGSSRESARRIALANWITDPRNPLTARVIVNRLWCWHFGQGLVATPSDFGFQGGRSTHPELLDWLARELVEPSQGEPWRLKRIQRWIVTSAAYRQSTRISPKTARVDADNRLLSRFPTLRLDAEQVRDALLSVSGQLDPTMGGPGFRDYAVSSAGNNETYTVFDAIGPEYARRSLYRTCLRTGTSPMLDILDCPDPSVATPRRTVTNTPLQALTMLNNRFVEHAATRFAERVEREAASDPVARSGRVFALALGRPPNADETRFGADYIQRHGLREFCLVVMNLNEFIFLD